MHNLFPMTRPQVLRYDRINKCLLLSKISRDPEGLYGRMLVSEVVLMGKELEKFCSGNDNINTEMDDWIFQLSSNYYQQELFIFKLINEENFKITTTKNTSHLFLRYRIYKGSITKGSNTYPITISAVENKDEIYSLPYNSIYGTNYVLNGCGYTRADSHIPSDELKSPIEETDNKHNLIVDKTGHLIEGNFKLTYMDGERLYLDALEAMFSRDLKERYLGDEKSFVTGLTNERTAPNDFGGITIEDSDIVSNEIWMLLGHNLKRTTWMDSGKARIFKQVYEDQCNDTHRCSKTLQNTSISAMCTFLGHNIINAVFTLHDVRFKFSNRAVDRYIKTRGRSAALTMICTELANQLWESDIRLVPELGHPTHYDVKFIYKILTLMPIRRIIYTVRPVNGPYFDEIVIQVP